MLLRHLGEDKAVKLNSGEAAEELRAIEEFGDWKFDEGFGESEV